jgi:hypothetical protein
MNLRNPSQTKRNLSSSNIFKVSNMRDADDELARTNNVPHFRRATLKPPNNVKFRSAIQGLVADLEKRTNQNCSITQLYTAHHIKRRRLYDIVNVFTGIGCATRSGSEALVWHGRDKILPELLRAKTNLGVHDPSKTLENLFPADSCVGLSALTVAFLLLFAALQVEVIDLRKASAFFARERTKYKTTQCKLYQIALILGALEITQRHKNVSEIKLTAPYNRLIDETWEEHPLAIASLLSRPVQCDAVIEQRKAEFERFSIHTQSEHHATV